VDQPVQVEMVVLGGTRVCQDLPQDLLEEVVVLEMLETQAPVLPRVSLVSQEMMVLLALLVLVLLQPPQPGQERMEAMVIQDNLVT